MYPFVVGVLLCISISGIWGRLPGAGGGLNDYASFESLVKLGFLGLGLLFVKLDAIVVFFER